MKYIFENNVEFYITNICNLTCENCNRFNNHKFTGWQRWSDYADIYQQWSEYIMLKNIVILGGEPLLNPTITDWITGLSKVFKSPVQVLTNGLHLNKVPGLYDAMVQTRQYNAKGCFIQISLHNTEHFDQIRQNIKNFLSTSVEEYGTAVDLPSSVPGRNSYYSLRDVNNVLVNVHLDNNFFDAAVYKNNQGQFTLRNSDPFLAHQACGFAAFKCYHFIRGKLYKCGPVALMPEFDQQHHLAISDEDRQLLNNYQPLTIEHWPDSAVDWLAKLDDPIAQCKFCPTFNKQNTIYPTVKNIKIQ